MALNYCSKAMFLQPVYLTNTFQFWMLATSWEQRTSTNTGHLPVLYSLPVNVVHIYELASIWVIIKSWQWNCCNPTIYYLTTRHVTCACAAWQHYLVHQKVSGGQVRFVGMLSQSQILVPKYTYLPNKPVEETVLQVFIWRLYDAQLLVHM